MAVVREARGQGDREDVHAVGDRLQRPAQTQLGSIGVHRAAGDAAEHAAHVEGRRAGGGRHVGERLMLMKSPGEVRRHAAGKRGVRFR